MSHKCSNAGPPEAIIWQGEALHTLCQMPRSFVDVIVTSPPYFLQRDYGHQEQLGREETVKAYVDRLVAILAEAKEVLQPTGSLWLVMGDKYFAGRLLGIPWRVALAMESQGWILRSDIIWHKPNAIPSPVKNRPTVDHEYVFFFVRSDNYFYDADAIREPHVTFSPQSKMRGGRKHLQAGGQTPERGKYAGIGKLHDGTWERAFHPKGRNKRTVWSVPLSKSRDAHFAVFPEKLVKTILTVSCPEGGLVLDPFMGIGTTLAVANALGHRAWGIDLQIEYCQIARNRLLKQGCEAEMRVLRP